MTTNISLSCHAIYLKQQLIAIDVLGRPWPTWMKQLQICFIMSKFLTRRCFSYFGVKTSVYLFIYFNSLHSTMMVSAKLLCATIAYRACVKVQPHYGSRVTMRYACGRVMATLSEKLGNKEHKQCSVELQLEAFLVKSNHLMPVNLNVINRFH